MKPLTTIALLGSAGCAVLGIIMFQNNPKQQEYEKYAIQQLITYLKSDVCQKTPNFLENLVKIDCDQLVDSANPQIKDLITATTTRQDYLLFSVYRTEIKLNSWIPGYKFETVGVLNQFYTYTAAQQ